MTRVSRVFISCCLVVFMIGLCITVNAEQQGTTVQLTLESNGVRFSAINCFFAAPYIVQSGDTFQSISQTFYNTPEYAEFLAQKNEMPVDAQLAPETSILLIVTDFVLKFKPERPQTQSQIVRSFINKTGSDTIYKQSWIGDVSLAQKDGKLIYKKINPKSLELTALTNKELQIIFYFIQQPLLKIFGGNTEIEAVEVKGNF